MFLQNKIGTYINQTTFKENLVWPFENFKNSSLAFFKWKKFSNSVRAGNHRCFVFKGWNMSKFYSVNINALNS